jgi:hypothetical protein
MGAIDQEPPPIAITSFRDAQLRITLAGLASFGPKAELTADIPALTKVILISYGQDIGERRQRAHSTDLRSGPCFWILLFRPLQNEFVIGFDLLVNGLYLRQQRF